MAGSRSAEALWRVALRLRPQRSRGKRLPRLLFFTDPARVADPAAVIATLPRGAGVVYRAFGAADAVSQGRRLASAARRRGLLFLVGADAALASRLGADGVHLPQRLVGATPGLRRARPDWLITAAAHSARALAAARLAGVDAVVASPVFPSRSPSAGRPIGPLRLAQWASWSPVPVYALGGVNAETARRLIAIPLAGFAAIEALTPPLQTASKRL